jgi:hypothetical protein
MVDMRKWGAAVAVSMALVACSTSSSPTTTRYYDPNGLFSTQLPEPNDVLVMPPQRIPGTPALLSGVLALPPQPSPTPSNQPFGGGIGQTTNQPQDTAIYGVFVVKAGQYSKIEELVRALLSGTLSPSILSQQPIRADTLHGILLVVDHIDDTGGGADYTDASAFFLDGNVGYWVREMFARGQWGSRRDAFLRIVHSFQPGVPPGLPAIPITRQGLEVRSGIGWPLG